MNGELENNDDKMFDRLVDGELSADERRRLVASLDEQAGGWRRCALAFLEAQSWQGAMTRVVHGPDAKFPGSFVAQLAESHAVAGPPRLSKRPAGWSTWLAAAAAMLAAFSAGWRMNGGESLGDAQFAAGAGSAADAREARPPEAPAVPLANPDAITLVVRDADGQARRVQVPLVEGRRLGEQFAESPQWAAPEMRRRLAEQGIDLKARRRYAPLYFEQQDGIVPMVVPVDDAVITPVSSAVY